MTVTEQLEMAQRVLDEHVLSIVGGCRALHKVDV